MIRRPIFWGIVMFLVSGLGWFLLVILSAITLGKFSTAANFSGTIAALSLPVAVIWEAIRRKRKKI